MDNKETKKILNKNVDAVQPLENSEDDHMIGGGSILLFINWFAEPNKDRMAEYVKCLKRNIDNIYIDRIYVICEQGSYPNFSDKISIIESKNRPTFNMMFEIANKISDDNDFVIIANTDIYFDNSINMIKNRMNAGDVYALTRWDIMSDGTVNFHNRKDSQDVWIFKGKIRTSLHLGNYFPGIAGCDNKLAFELEANKYILHNPSLSIKIYHLHLTNIRNYKNGSFVNRVQPPYKFINPSYLNQKENKLKTIFHIGLNTKFQKSLEAALKTIGNYYQFDWAKFDSGTDKNILIRKIFEMCMEIKPDYIFAQIQTADVLTFQLVKRIVELFPEIKIINWNGDIRLATPPWMLDIAKFDKNVHTAFTNYRDIEYMKSYGYKNVHHIQIGFEESVFNPHVPKMLAPPDIYFTGNNYGEKFPLTKLRLQVISKGKIRYGNKFQVYGQGWSDVGGGLIISKEKTASMYRSSKIGISINNINAFRYSSDRLFNIMGSGSFALAHYYDGIELDFENKKHLVWWNTVDELFHLIDYYLKNEDERKQIADAGCKKVWDEFRWIHRIDFIKQHIFT